MSNKVGITRGDNLTKGLGIIIACKNNKDPNNYTTDSIVNCDAKCFSLSTPTVLQESDLKKIGDDKILYLCGHGKISGYTIKEIAVMLKEHGYSGKQILCDASCYAARKVFGKNLAECLQESLKEIGIECKAIALSYDISIVFNGADGNAACVSVQYPKIVRKVLFEFQSVQFPSFPVQECKKDLKENYNSVMNWNTDIASGHYNALFACNGDFLLVLFAFVVSVICYFVGIPLSASEPLILLWLLAEFTSFRGYFFSIFLWLPVMLVGLQWNALIVILRVVLGLVLTIVFDCRYLFKFVINKN